MGIEINRDLSPIFEVSNLVAQDELQRRFEIVVAFNVAVDHLRTKFPDSGINELMDDLVLSVSEGITPLEVSQSAGTVMLERYWDEGQDKGRILIPDDFLERVKNDTYSELGYVVNTASQVRDHLNFQGTQSKDIRESTTGMVTRAGEWQARFLRKVKTDIDQEYQIDPYQRELLKMFG